MNAAAVELFILGVLMLAVPALWIGAILVSTDFRHPGRDCLLVVLLLGLTWLGAWNIAGVVS